MRCTDPLGADPLSLIGNTRIHESTGRYGVGRGG